MFLSKFHTLTSDQFQSELKGTNFLHDMKSRRMQTWMSVPVTRVMFGCASDGTSNF